MIADMLFADQGFTFSAGLFRQNSFPPNEFESAYIDIRKKEGRILTNDEIRKLPDVSKDHPHFHEWKIRTRSLQRLAKYLDDGKERIILEVGCGNGWLSHQLSKIKKAQVIGIDVNFTELQQASKVFEDIPNLVFILGDIFSIHLPVKVDHIVLASSAQYFPDLFSLIKALKTKLSDGGEIHIIDTPFYNAKTVDSARSRSRDYFNSHDSGMGGHYIHHAWTDLEKFNFELLYEPSTFLSKLKNKFSSDSPFPWIKISNV
jgi:SAM-dependent methyltransferase